MQGKSFQNHDFFQILSFLLQIFECKHYKFSEETDSIQIENVAVKFLHKQVGVWKV